MKKRLLFLLMGIVLVVLLTGCACKHEWVEATCLNPRTCSACSETEGEALGHTWVDATCTADGVKVNTCPLCGDTFAEGTEPDRCPLCNFPKAKYIEI